VPSGAPVTPRPRQSASCTKLSNRAPARSLLAASVVAAIATSSLSLRADEPFALAPDDIPSAFFVAKSQNRNQVHYGVHVDRACRPVGAAPLFGYWRMLENRGRLEPLLDREEPAYGLCEGQTIEAVEGNHSTIRVCLRAMPDRPVLVNVDRAGSKCIATATTMIAGAESRLHFVYAKLAWVFGIDYLLLRGARDVGGGKIEEVVRR
jgi:hypothetical protein